MADEKQTVPDNPFVNMMTGVISGLNAIAPHNVIPRMVQSLPPLPGLPGLPGPEAKGGITPPVKGEDYIKNLQAPASVSNKTPIF